MQFKLIRMLAAVAVSAALILSSSAGSASEIQFWTDTPEGGHVAKAQTLPDFVDLAAKLSPAVVNISTEGTEQGGSEGEFPAPYGHQHGKSLGSGFIVSKDGYILTNDHVIENPSKVTVTLQDGHNYTAKVIGGDSKTDVALLKIDAGHELAVAPLGNSDDLKVGQWVMAIGNPFGFDHTVTVGVVSAKGRFLPDSVDQFIQTDASINPGNSGGPLIDLSGGVVGVNAAIFTSTGRSMGIGFAIPINLVKEELSELRDHGKVKHGWLGVMIQEVTPELAESMDLKEARGALVAEVIKNSPAAIAGVKRGDVIIEFDGHPIKDRRELPLLVTRTPLGKTVTFKIVREKQEKDLVANITESQEAELAAAESRPKMTGTPSSFGLRVQDLSPDLAHELGLDSGVLISGVEPGSRGDEVGLQARDVILEVNRSPVKDVSSYQQALKAGGKGSIVLLLVKRGDSTLYFALKPEA
ncbi:MAG TPA: DegQ family serine endoprotease [Candidatus Binataceae bacterium]|jgi:serine protease Do